MNIFRTDTDTTLTRLIAAAIAAAFIVSVLA